MEIVERILRSGEPQMQQLAGSVIDVDKQGAFGAAVLEPPVMLPIDLDQFTETIASAARLENPLLALAPRDPYAGLGHPFAQRLLADAIW